MIYVMIQGANIRGAFESVSEAKVFFSETTNTDVANIKDKESFNGDILFLVNNYAQARLKKTILY